MAGLLACGPPVVPPTPAPARDPLAQTWTIRDHVISTISALTDDDAAVFQGRTIEIDDSGYTTPWHGACEEAVRQRRDRILADVVSELDIAASGRALARTHGLLDELVEHRLTCSGTKTAPPLTIYLSNDVSIGRAMTCFGGVCYFLTGGRQ